MTDGLDEAIKAAARARYILWGYDKTLEAERFESDIADDAANDASLRAAITAAAPYIRREVLLEVAGQVDLFGSDPSFLVSAGIVANMLRERAKREEPVPVTQAPPQPEDDRNELCVERWPDCTVGGYDPRCCRFPKSCSCWKD